MITKEEYEKALETIKAYEKESSDRDKIEKLTYDIEYIKKEFPIGTVLLNKSGDIIGEVVDYVCNESSAYSIWAGIRNGDEVGNISSILPINAIKTNYVYVYPKFYKIRYKTIIDNIYDKFDGQEMDIYAKILENVDSDTYSGKDRLLNAVKKAVHDVTSIPERDVNSWLDTYCKYE